VLIPASVLIALLLDQWWGEPKRWHPLVGFGCVANWLETRLNRPTPAWGQRLSGIAAVMLLLVPISSLVYLFVHAFAAAWVVAILFLYLAVGAKSLTEHATHVSTALDQGDLAQARLRVSYLVSRQTDTMNPNDIAKASIESVLENGSDALFGAVFWFLVAGAPGVVFYRLSNTLDAMWGYKTPRFKQFGWAAAKLDDVLNWIPARLTALTYALCGHSQTALSCWRQQSASWESQNAGPVIAAGAGALALELGGAAQYHGQIKFRPRLGQGKTPTGDDIQRSIRLLQQGEWVWVVCIFIMAGGWHLAWLT